MGNSKTFRTTITPTLILLLLGCLPAVNADAAQPRVRASSPDARNQDWASGPIRQVAGRSDEGGWVSSIGSSFKAGIGRIATAVTPKRTAIPASDPISLDTRSKPSAQLYMATAGLAEQSGKPLEAARLYERALAINPRHVPALIGYARLKDRQDRVPEAIELYQSAAEAQPNHAPTFNDLGICYARQRALDQSVVALERAIRLDPKKELYRNNLALVLVEAGRIDEAVKHLRAVQGDAVAYYNVGYILQKKGDKAGAARLFSRALQEDPTLADARTWLEEIRRRQAATLSAVSQRVPQYERGSAFPQRQTGSAFPQRQAGSAFPQRQAGSAFPQVATTPRPPTREVPNPRTPPPTMASGSGTMGQASTAHAQQQPPLPPPTSMQSPAFGGPSQRTGPRIVQPLPPIIR